MEDRMKKQKKMKLGLAVGAGVLVLGSVLVLAGCGGGSSSPGGSTPSGGNPPPPPVVVASDPNGEGVRSDVRAYIEEQHADSAKARAALFQYAKVMEKALADASDKQLSIQHAEDADKAITCMIYTAGSVNGSTALEGNLMSIILNTDERNKAYFAYNDQLGGQVFKGIPYDQRASACDIDPSTLPN